MLRLPLVFGFIKSRESVREAVPTANNNVDDHAKAQGGNSERVYVHLKSSAMDEEKRKRPVIADDEEDEEEVVVNNEETEPTEDGEQQAQQPDKEEADEEEDGMDDLFGDDDDGDNEIDSKPADEDGIVHDSNDEDDDGVSRIRRRHDDDDDDDGEDQFLVREEVQSRELRVGEADVIRHPPKFDNKDEPVVTAKVPKFIHVNPTRFDGTDYLKHLEQLTHSGLTKQDIDIKKLEDENTIRWRFTKQSNESLTAESNAQIIEWEDGSFSLKLGGEFFNVLSSSVSDTFLVTSDDSVLKKKSATPDVYVADGTVSKTMKFVPTSTNSKIHQKLTAAVRARQKTKATTQTVVVEVDPALEAKRLEKEQEDRLREKRRQQLKLEREQERTGGSMDLSRERYSTREQYGRATDDYDNDDGFIDDDDEDDDDVMEEVDEDEDVGSGDDDDDDDLAAERLKRVKAEGAAKYESSADAEESQTRKKRRVIEDDEDDE